MKAIIALCLVGYAVAAPMGEFEHDFIRFVAKNNRMYGTKEEYNFRLNTFSQNAKFIEEFNKLGKKQTVEINNMADWTHEEYKQLLGTKQEDVAEEFVVDPVSNAASVDWRSKGAVTHVKNQGQCGSCWTFSSTGSLEGRHFQKSGVLTSFSEQQLVDCCHSGVGGCNGSMGCNGGFMSEALTYSQTYDLMTEADYPYVAYDQACAYKGAGTGAGYTNSSKVAVTPYSASALKDSIAVGPTSIAV
eukprot:scpid95523/ scgid22992/ Cysteine proteinase 5